MKRHAPEEAFDDMPLFTAAAESEKRAARERAELGMARAATRAEVIRPGWHVATLAAVRKHAEQHEFFLAEDVHIDVPASADPRAVGAIFREAVREGCIVADGYAPANSSNRSPKTRWKSRVFVGTEQHA
jgi:hypothetical protein